MKSRYSSTTIYTKHYNHASQYLDKKKKNTQKLNNLFIRCDKSFNFKPKSISLLSPLLKPLSSLPSNIMMELWQGTDLLGNIHFELSADDTKEISYNHSKFNCSANILPSIIIQQIRLGKIDPCTTTIVIKNNDIDYNLESGYGCVVYTIHDIPVTIEFEQQINSDNIIKLYLTIFYNLIQLFLDGKCGSAPMIRSHNQGDRINIEIIYPYSELTTIQNLNNVMLALNGHPGSNTIQPIKGMLPFSCFFNSSDIKIDETTKNLDERQLQKISNNASYKWWSWIKKPKELN
mgnify:CR=1 FL=1